MELTKEQEAIVNSTGNIKINAVAGSGKTTTIIEYAKTRPRTDRILYLAFNKTVKLEAIKKFGEAELTNVVVETAHSLAYKNSVFKHGYKVRHQGYKTHEIADLLQLTGNGEKHTEYIVANHINRFIAYFCNSNKQKVQELNYLETISDPKASTFARTFYTYIEKKTRLLLSKMDKGEVEITHDFYLKKFQLSKPELHFDYILFDEGQDASPAMLDVFLQQKATKVIVGDTHQQIYGWRFAVNSLEKVAFKTFHLSNSFRFGKQIANLSMAVLKWKKHLDNRDSISIIGKEVNKERKTKAILARTNLGLLLKAIEYATEKPEIKRIYFEGNINSYTYADDGASLYDVLSLHNNNRRGIRDKLIRQMKDLKELEGYIEKTGDVQLGLMIEIVKKYGNDIPKIIKKIKDKHIEGDDREKAEVIFSTVHRCKGMEYDSILLVKDFINEEKLVKLESDLKEEEWKAILPQLNEEINLLYVAITRAKNTVHIPESLLPKGISPSSHIHVIKDESEEESKNSGRDNVKRKPRNSGGEKSYSVEKIREKHKGAYNPWTAELDIELTEMYCEGTKTQKMAEHFGRTLGAIQSRVKKLELKDLYD